MWDIDKSWQKAWCYWGILYIADMYKHQNMFYDMKLHFWLRSTNSFLKIV